LDIINNNTVYLRSWFAQEVCMGVGHAYGPLSQTVEDRLVRRLVTGDRGARRRLIESYMGLVAAIARRYARWGVPLEDLFQEGALALVQAVDHYDPGKGMRLSTYVTWWVKQAIRRATLAPRSTR
jgi:DNA-directed RNA polymerase sigma subunit (sigma70/sigma32)